MADVDIKKLVELCNKEQLGPTPTLGFMLCATLCTKDGVVSSQDSLYIEALIHKMVPTSDWMDELREAEFTLTVTPPFLVSTDKLDKAIKKPRKKANMDLTPEQDKLFEAMWAAWPARSSDGKLARGDKLPARRNFAILVSTGKATAAELVAAAAIYLCEHPNVKNGFVRQVRTFLNPEEGIWYESIEIVRKRAESPGFARSER